MLAAPLAAFAANPVSLDMAMKTLERQQPPRMVEEILVLTLKPGEPARFVGARFAHESWNVLHPYAVNESGVFVLDYPVPEGLREIRYRIVVDGLWMADPTNPRADSDAVGNEFSVFTLEKEPFRPIVNPRPERDGSVTFTFRGATGRRVAIVGDFNNWDPFMDLLQEKTPGTYTVTLRLRPGRHWYCFFSGGDRILDRYNTDTGVDPDGTTVSSCFLSP
jgi:1,4-alpha-glucan branching enzyme